MAELVDALVSGTSIARCGGSSPLLGTKRRTKPLPIERSGAAFSFTVEKSAALRPSASIPRMDLLSHCRVANPPATRGLCISVSRQAASSTSRSSPEHAQSRSTADRVCQNSQASTMVSGSACRPIMTRRRPRTASRPIRRGSGPGPSKRTPDDEQRASGHASDAQRMELSLIWPIQGYLCATYDRLDRDIMPNLIEPDTERLRLRQ